MDVTEPAVRMAAGLVRRRAKGGVAVFRGIPFAQPPVGDRRFAARARPGPGTANGRRPPSGRPLLQLGFRSRRCC